MRARQVGRERCLRALRPGEIKRHPLTGPLYGYAVACPSCGFRALHDDPVFTEDRERLRAATAPLPCLGCGGVIQITHDEITCNIPVSPASDS